MSTHNVDEPKLLKQLGSLLDHSPAGQEASLRQIHEELSLLPKDLASTTVEQAYQSFGTAVGRDKGWQTLYRETGILATALKDLDSSDRSASLRKQYLRVIGNCVADNNPAKAATAALRLDSTISRELFLGHISEAGLDYAVDLLTWATGKLTADQLKDEYSLETFAGLLKVALQYDEDHYHEYVAIIVHYLQDPEFQQKVATPKFADDLVVLMLDFEGRLAPAELEAVFQELSITKSDEQATSEETNVLLLSQLINSISALSATDAFSQNFTVRSPVIERIRTSLGSPISRSPSTVCTCVMLGNLAMSDEVCIDMVSIMQLYMPLRDIIFFDRHSALQYAALGFLRHLAFPEANRTVLGDARIIEACHNFIASGSDDPAVRGEMAALLCKLVTNNPKNIERVVMYRVGERRGEPGELPSQSVSNGPTCLGDMVKQSLLPAKPLPSTAMKNFMVEAGRTIVAILRYLGRSAAGGGLDVDTVRLRMFECADIAKPLAKLLRQLFYADARSESLLGLGLMAQSHEGAARVIEAIKEDDGLLEAIKDFAEGKDGGVEQQGQAGGRDYQNAMVLLQALQNNWAGDEADAALKDKIMSLQELLGKLMV